MKRIFFYFLMIVPLALMAQTDVTDTYIINADFDNGTMINEAPRGWTLDLTTKVFL